MTDTQKCSPRASESRVLNPKPYPTCPSESSRMLAVQGSCELAYSPAVAMHLPVAAWRGVGTTFVAGRTTAVVPRNSSNVFGARYVAL